jgi:hypothetical protein
LLLLIDAQAEKHQALIEQQLIACFQKWASQIHCEAAPTKTSRRIFQALVRSARFSAFLHQ